MAGRVLTPRAPANGNVTTSPGLAIFLFLEHPFDVRAAGQREVAQVFIGPLVAVVDRLRGDVVQQQCGEPQAVGGREAFRFVVDFTHRHRSSPSSFYRDCRRIVMSKFLTIDLYIVHTTSAYAPVAIHEKIRTM